MTKVKVIFSYFFAKQVVIPINCYIHVTWESGYVFALFWRSYKTPRSFAESFCGLSSFAGRSRIKFACSNSCKIFKPQVSGGPIFS